jgi:hypothetical protein
VYICAILKRRRQDLFVFQSSSPRFCWSRAHFGIIVLVCSFVCGCPEHRHLLHPPWMRCFRLSFRAEAGQAGAAARPSSGSDPIRSSLDQSWRREFAFAAASARPTDTTRRQGTFASARVLSGEIGRTPKIAARQSRGLSHSRLGSRGEEKIVEPLGGR